MPAGASVGADIEQIVRAEGEKWFHLGYRAHGDFTIENVFWESFTKTVSIIDWELPLQGLPPLYDTLTFLLSSVPALALQPFADGSTDSRYEQQFLAAFFGSSRWAEMTRKLLLDARARVPVSDVDIWKEFLLTLVVRANYFFSRHSSFGQLYARLLELAAQHEKGFVCPSSH
jgi:hypothetical protein